MLSLTAVIPKGVSEKLEFSCFFYQMPLKKFLCAFPFFRHLMLKWCFHGLTSVSGSLTEINLQIECLTAAHTAITVPANSIIVGWISTDTSNISCQRWESHLSCSMSICGRSTGKRAKTEFACCIYRSGWELLYSPPGGMKEWKLRQSRSPSES